MRSIILSLSVLIAPLASAQGPNCNAPDIVSGTNQTWNWGVSGGASGLPNGPCDFFSSLADGFYQWTAPADGHYVLESSSSTAYARVAVYSGLGCAATQFGCAIHGHAPDSVEVPLGLLSAGDPILVRGGVSYTGTWSIEFAGSDCASFAEDSFAPNHSCLDRKPIDNGTYSNLALLPGAERDWFSVCVAPGETMQVSATNTQNTPMLFGIFVREIDPNGSGCGTISGGIATSDFGSAPNLMHLNTTNATQHFDLQISGGIGDHCGSYDLNISGTDNCGVGSAPTTFCAPMIPNSTGQSTQLNAITGTGVQSGFRLEASQGPPNQFASLIIGDATDPWGTPLGGGFFCLGQNPGDFFGRYNISGTAMNSIGQFDAAGIFQNLVGTSQVGTGFDIPLEIPTLGGTIQSGQTWHFQLWHRENAGQSNWSNGVSIKF